MRNRNQLSIGLGMILLGAIFLAANLLKIDLGRIFWPLILILVGVWMLLRPRIAMDNWLGGARFISDVSRRGAWQVVDQEFRSFVGDVDLDFSHADVPDGETHFRIQSFVGDVDVIVPHGIGVSIAASGVVSEVRVFGRKQSSVFGPVEMQTDGYAIAGKKIRITLDCFVSDVSVLAA